MGHKGWRPCESEAIELQADLSEIGDMRSNMGPLFVLQMIFARTIPAKRLHYDALGCAPIPSNMVQARMPCDVAAQRANVEVVALVRP